MSNVLSPRKKSAVDPTLGPPKPPWVRFPDLLWLGIGIAFVILLNVLPLGERAGAMLLDGEFRIRYFNPAAERIFGYTAEEVIGKSVTILIPEDHIDEEPSILRRIKSGEHVEHYETVRVAKGGRLIDISLTVSPIKDATGTIIGASKVARDISERKRSEAAFAEQTAIIEAVNSVGQTLAGELDLHKLAQVVTDAATRICDARVGSFFYRVLDEHGESIRTLGWRTFR